MKILHVIAQLPARTGSGVYYSAVIEEMKKFGYDQHALFAVQDDYRFDILEHSRQYPVCFKSHELPFPIPGMSDVMPYENTVYSEMDEEMLLKWSDAFEKALKQARENFDPDIVLLHHLWILSSMGAGIFDDKIKIGICHNTDIRQAEQHPKMKAALVTNLGKLTTVFSLCDAQKQNISRVFGIELERIATIGGGFNQSLFYPPAVKRKNDKVQILYSAKIESSKGIFELVKAFKSLNKENVQLNIVGTPNRENERILNSLIGNASNITLVPIKNQSELADFIRGMDIFVMPSYFEGLGLMAIECLACGLRVVATEIEGLMSLLGHKVNHSGLIEYVALPRIYDTDKPYEEDLDGFVERLASKLLIQITNVENDVPLPDEMLADINRHSWCDVAARIHDEILKLEKITAESL